MSPLSLATAASAAGENGFAAAAASAASTLPTSNGLRSLRLSFTKRAIVAKLLTDGIAHLNSKVLAAMTTDQIAALTTDQVTALTSGQIAALRAREEVSCSVSPEQFVDLNQRIGGLDIDNQFQAGRTVGDPGSESTACW